MKTLSPLTVCLFTSIGYHERLKMITDLRISGELNHDDFMKRLNQEKLFLETKMNTLADITKDYDE